MSSATTQLRANENSSLYTAIKNRSSATGGAGCQQIYKSEINHCPSVKTRVEIPSQSNPGFDRTIQFVLPNYGFLDQLYLRTKFSAKKAVVASGVNNGVSLVWGAGAFVFNEARLVYQGHTVARLSPEYIITRYLTESSASRRDYFGRMIGADATITNTAGGFETTGVRLSADPDARTIGLEQLFNCPLPFFFEESLSRSIDLGILQSPLHLEIDVGSQARSHSVATTAGNMCDISSMNVVAYMTELHPDEQRQFRAVSYQPGGTPLTQLAFNTTTHIESALAHGSKHSIKLNMFSGLVERLYVYARVAGTATSATVKDYYSLVPIKSLKLQSTGTDIVDLDNLSGEDKDLEWFSTKAENLPPIRNATTANTDENHTGKYLENIYCINFKQGWNNRASADGSLAFGTLSIPQLEVEFETTATNGDWSGSVAAAPVDLIIIAEQLDMVSYQTNSQGATSIRSIQE